MEKNSNDSTREKMARKRNVKEIYETVPNPEIPILFAKTLEKWNKYESTLPFKSQRPHFFPLSEYPAPLKEKLALALVETFIELSETIKDSQIPYVELPLYMESLVDLGTHGFEVKALIDKVSKHKQKGSEEEKSVYSDSDLRRSSGDDETPAETLRAKVEKVKLYLERLGEKISAREERVSQLQQELEDETIDLAYLKRREVIKREYIARLSKMLETKKPL